MALPTRAIALIMTPVTTIHVQVDMCTASSQLVPQSKGIEEAPRHGQGSKLIDGGPPNPSGIASRCEDPFERLGCEAVDLEGRVIRRSSLQYPDLDYDADLQAGFLSHLAHQGFVQRLPGFDPASRERPPARFGRRQADTVAGLTPRSPFNTAYVKQRS